MSTALLEPPVRHERDYGQTLEELLNDALAGTAQCPICGDELEHTLMAAECKRCGSRLS
jgi:hypothetical protein